MMNRSFSYKEWKNDEHERRQVSSLGKAGHTLGKLKVVLVLEYRMYIEPSYVQSFGQEELQESGRSVNIRERENWS